MNVSSYLILDTRRSKKSGKYPVKVRVNYMRKSRHYLVGLDLTQEEFDESISEKPKIKFKTNAMILNSIKTKVDRIINDLGIFTFNKFENEFYGKLKEASNLYKIFDEYIENLLEEKRIKTADSYTSAKNSFKKFKPSIGLYDVSASFLKEYHSFQIRKGLSETTIGIYVRSLRSIYNYSISNGLIKRDESYPFGKRQYVIPAGRNIKKALSLDQVRMISNYPCDYGSIIDRSRDMWLFSYLCNGINFKDIAELKKKNIDGSMLRFIRAKTKNSTRGNQTIISCALTEKTFHIISKWRKCSTDP